MGWSIGYDINLKRDIGYGVPAICDHPDCSKKIDRGLAYVCGGEPYGGEYGCGLFFCESHLLYDVEKVDGIQKCEQCLCGEARFDPKPDSLQWVRFKLKDKSWKQWREENPDEVARMRAAVTPPPEAQDA